MFIILLTSNGNSLEQDSFPYILLLFGEEKRLFYWGLRYIGGVH